MADPLVRATRERALRQYTWGVVSSNLDLNGTRFMLQFFINHPEFLSKFAFSKEKDIEKSFALKNHGKLILKTIGDVLASNDLDTNPAVKERLTQLGTRHILEYKVNQRDHMRPVKFALLWTVATAMGKYWTEELSDLWERTLEEVVNYTTNAGLAAAMAVSANPMLAATLLARGHAAH